MCETLDDPPLGHELGSLNDARLGGGNDGSAGVDGAADVLSTLPCLLKAPLPPRLLPGFCGLPKPTDDDGATQLLFCLLLWLNLPRPRHPPLEPVVELDFPLTMVSVEYRET